MHDWHVLINRSDYLSTCVVELKPRDLEPGEVRLRVDSFGLTANNVTYAAAGDMIGYWAFFPSPDVGAADANVVHDDSPTRWGRTPVWGFADVVETTLDDIVVGERLYGYLPMSTELIIAPSRVSAERVTDGAPHRADLPTVYNQLHRCDADPGYDAEHEAEQMLYRPLFATSFLIDDLLDELLDAANPESVSTVVLASASSKTAFGVAHLLARRPGIRVVGLTSPRNVDFVTSLGCYDDVIAYGDASSHMPEGPAAFVDMSGNPAVVRTVHEHYGDNLVLSSAVGLTHWENFGEGGGALPGPAQQRFFAPARIEQRHQDWGAGELEARLDVAWAEFVSAVSGWVTIEHHSGPEAVREVWTQLVAGSTSPDHAHILHAG